MLEEIWKLKEKLNSSNGVAIAVVYVILLIDNMLLTAVVPILPEYFYTEHQHETKTSQDLTKNTILPAAETTTTPEYENLTYSTTNENISSNCRSSASNHFLVKENLYIGLLFASKPLVQSFANLAVGPVVDRIGFDFPMLFGNMVMMASGLIFAFGRSYSVLLVARAIQGIGSASASVAGIAMLASRYSDQEEEDRGKAIGLALGGLAMGVLVGPPFAAGVYQLAGKESVFVVLAIVAFLLALIQLFIRGFHFKSSNKMSEPVPLCTLLRDPYILLTAATIVFGNSGIAILEASQPLWMLTTMCSEKWELGVAFLPTSVSYLISVNLVAVCGQKIPRWLIGMVGLFFVGAGCLGVPFAKSLVGLILPSYVHGTGIGLVDASTFPMMAVLVDTRHRAVYGGVYAIADLSFCVPYVLGPLYAGGAIRFLGFNWLIWSFVITVLLFSPFLLFLRKVTSYSEETKPILYQANTSDDDVFQLGEKNGSMISSTSEKELSD